MEFRLAIAQANDLLTACNGNPQALSSGQLLPFLADEEGARGFFVAWLTGDWGFDQAIPYPLKNALKEKQTPAFSVLVRNLAMSSATEAAHKRNGDMEKAAMSQRVVQRTANLIKELNEGALWTLLSEMRGTLIGESGVFSDFLGRMRYGDDEKMAALKAVEQALAASPRHKPDSLDMRNPFQ